MPALTLEGELVNISYSYDALTIYPTCSEEINDIISCVKKCGQFAFVMKVPEIDLEEPTKEGLALEECFDELEAEFDFQRYVDKDDDDHTLYHQDQFSSAQGHYHIKFNHSLKRAEIFQMMELFEERGLLIKEQKEFFMRAFDKRYAELRAAIDAILAPKETDSPQNTRRNNVQGLLILIKTCEDNDKLVNLHEYLLEEKFDSLREITKGCQSKEWQGTDLSDPFV